MFNEDFNYLISTQMGQIVFHRMCDAVLFTKDQMINEMRNNQELAAEFISKVIMEGTE
jgi:hypothetical protein